MKNLILGMLVIVSFGSQASSWSFSLGGGCSVSSDGATESYSKTVDGNKLEVCGFTGSEGSVSLSDSEVTLEDGIIEWDGERLPLFYETAHVQLRLEAELIQLWVNDREINL